MIGKWQPISKEVDVKNIVFSLNKNGAVVQQGNSKDMIHDIDKIIAHVSRFFSLNIGDVIFTGTPAGVGECVVGDQLEAFLMDESMLTLLVK